MKTKTKIIIIVVLLSLVGGVILYSTITANIESAKQKKKAREDFAKVWYSEEATKERENVLNEIIEEIGDKWKNP